MRARCLFGLYSEDVASDKRLDVTSVASSACLLRLENPERLTVDFEKSPGLGLFGKSGYENNNASCFLTQFFGRWSQVYLVDLQERASGSNVLHQPAYASWRCSLKWSNEKTSRRSTVRDV